MIQVTVQKNYIGLEDLLIGVGTVEQVRGPTGSAAVEITKINGANFPYDATYSMSEKFDALQALLDTLPVVVDEGGNLLTGLINTSSVALDLAGRLWRKTVSGTVAEIYYGTELLFKYNPTDGNLVLPENVDYIAADAVVTAAYEAADSDILDVIDALEASLGTVYEFDVGTSANNIVQLDGDGKLPAVDGSALTGISGVPIGTIIAVPYATVDEGWLACNGQLVSRTTYAALYTKLGDTYDEGDGSTTFGLPDYRGEFLRGNDNLRGVDTGRTLGSFQEDAFKSHTHTQRIRGSASGGGGNSLGGAGGGSPFTCNDATGATGSTETRPRNITVNYLIKAV